MNKINKSNKPSLKFALIGVIFYFAVIIIFSFTSFDLNVLTLKGFGWLLLVLLFIPGLSIGYSIAGDAQNLVVRYLGIILIAGLLVFPGALAAALMNWAVINF